VKPPAWSDLSLDFPAALLQEPSRPGAQPEPLKLKAEILMDPISLYEPNNEFNLKRYEISVLDFHNGGRTTAKLDINIQRMRVLWLNQSPEINFQFSIITNKNTFGSFKYRTLC
jgi:hypothetical protein